MIRQFNERIVISVERLARNFDRRNAEAALENHCISDVNICV